MSELVSVIVPIYCTARYLPKCIESILHQSYSELQIILVDDGSTDSSGAICDRYAKKHSRIQVIHLDKQHGPSAARNVGIGAAKGKYLMFCDSDDWMATDAVEILLKLLKCSDAELVFGQLWMVCPRHSRTASDVSDAVYHTSNTQEWIDCLRRINVGPCAKLFVTEIVKSHNLSFDTEIFYAEDALFLYQYLRFCSRVSSVSNIIYYYNHLPSTSLTHTYHPDFHSFLFRCHQQYLQALQIARDGVHDAMIDEEYVRRGTERFLGTCRLYLSLLTDPDDISEKIMESYQYFRDLIDGDCLQEIDKACLSAILDYVHGKMDFQTLYRILYDYDQLPYKRRGVKKLARSGMIEAKKCFLFELGRRKFKL